MSIENQKIWIWYFAADGLEILSESFDGKYKFLAIFDLYLNKLMYKHTRLSEIHGSTLTPNFSLI